MMIKFSVSMFLATVVMSVSGWASNAPVYATGLSLFDRMEDSPAGRLTFSGAPAQVIYEDMNLPERTAPGNSLKKLRSGKNVTCTKTRSTNGADFDFSYDCSMMLDVGQGEVY